MYLVSPNQSPAKRRVSNPQSWIRNSRKKLREAGKAYTGCIGESVPPKKVLDHKCRYKCFENIDENERQRLFDEFYKSSWPAQNAYLAGLRHIPNKVDNFERKRAVQAQWTISIDGLSQRIQVCKGAITCLFGLKSDSRLRFLDKYLQQGECRTGEARGGHIPVLR